MLTGFRWLAKLKGLRCTPFDVFGRTDERKTERALIGEYRAAVDELLVSLDPATLPLALAIARIPEEIRGYGHVKDRHLAAARPKWAALMTEWRNGGQRRAA
jgi:indolepyruvate ferredoxin oxidoreductase